jgi:beta-glucosidase
MGNSLPIELTLSNTGEREAEEIVQFYLSDLEATVPVPQHNLIGFERVSLPAGASKRVTFTITPEMMALFDNDGKQRLESGAFLVTVGGCSPSNRGLKLGAAKPVSAGFEVE